MRTKADGGGLIHGGFFQQSGFLRGGFVLATIEAGRSVSCRRRFNRYAPLCRTWLTLQISPQILRPETVRQRGLARDATRARHLRERLLHGDHSFRPARRDGG